MAYVPVPKDLTKVKTKVMFNLTRRQLVCFTAGALVGVPLFLWLREPAGNSMAAMCMMLVMMPFFLLAMYEKHGQPLEKIVGNILKVAVIRPKQRPYQTNNFYAVLKRQEMLDICDPEAEYAPLVERLHGQVIKISPTSTNYINPMDLNLDYSDDESPLSLKSDFILSLCELIVGGKEGLQPVQKTIIDRCVRLVYQTYLNDPRPENMPVLEDLYNLLREQEEKEAQYIAIKIYQQQ